MAPVDGVRNVIVWPPVVMLLPLPSFNWTMIVAVPLTGITDGLTDTTDVIELGWA
jgi:hypothetical protein